MAKEKKVRNGPSTNESGWTQASVSESMIDDDANITPPSTPWLVAIVSISKCDDAAACKGIAARPEDAIDANVDAIVRSRTEILGANPVHQAMSSMAMDNLLSTKTDVMVQG